MVPFGFKPCFPELQFVTRWICAFVVWAERVDPWGTLQTSKVINHVLGIWERRRIQCYQQVLFSGGVSSLCGWTAFTDASCKPNGNVWGWEGRGMKPGVFDVGSRLDSRKNMAATWCKNRFWSPHITSLLMNCCCCVKAGGFVLRKTGDGPSC